MDRFKIFPYLHYDKTIDFGNFFTWNYRFFSMDPFYVDTSSKVIIYQKQGSSREGMTRVYLLFSFLTFNEKCHI